MRLLAIFITFFLFILVTNAKVQSQAETELELKAGVEKKLNIKLEIIPESLWKLNKTAPSTASIYQTNSQNLSDQEPKNITTLAVSDLTMESNLNLERFTPGDNFFVDAKIYICEDKDGGRCKLKRVKSPLIKINNKDQNEISFKIDLR